MSIPAQSTASRLSEWFGHAAQIGAGISVGSYAFGWVLTARLYNSLGVDPEELGITPTWLAIRAFVVGVLAFAIALGARKLLTMARRAGQPITFVLRGRAATAIGLLVVCLSVGGIIVFGYLAWLAPDDTDPTGVVIAVGACALLMGVAVWVLRPSFTFSWNGRPWFRAAAGALSGFLVVGTVILPFRLADRLFTEVRAGHPVSVGLLGVHLIKVDRVQVKSADPGKPDPATECVSRLGSAAGTSVFVTNGAAIRLADQNITVKSPCQG